MLRCLVAAGSNALRRAAMRPRGDGALSDESNPHGAGGERGAQRLLNTTSLMRARELSRVRAARGS